MMTSPCPCVTRSSVSSGRLLLRRLPPLPSLLLIKWTSSSSSLIHLLVPAVVVLVAVLLPLLLILETGLLLLPVASAAGGATKLVIFAGPHKAASTSVESFFYDYASGHGRWGPDGETLDSDQRKKMFGLRYWMWPRIHGVVANETEREGGDGGAEEPFKIFGHLVSEPTNQVLESEILEGIRVAWETEGIEGVIVGSENFDQVGSLATTTSTTPHNDAIHALRKLVKYIGVPAQDVTVALNYRTPRLDQWTSMWAHAATTSKDRHHYQDEDEDEEKGEDEDDNNHIKYEDWICSSRLMAKHIEVLATQMNPLNAALAFVKEGWNVRLIDMEGVAEVGRDVTHVIACDVMNAECEEGVVVNHQDNNNTKNDPPKNVIDREFSALDAAQRQDAEQLFRSLDCAYEEDLRNNNDKFAIIYNHSVWQDCRPAELSSVYDRLKNEPETMYKALLSQVECPKTGSVPPPIAAKNRVDMHEALTGEVPRHSNPPPNEGAVATRSLGSVLLEFGIYVGILIAAMTYQYRRMTNSTNQPLRIGSHHPIETAEEGDEGYFTNETALDAEYGDADVDDDGVNDFHDDYSKRYKD